MLPQSGWRDLAARVVPFWPGSAGQRGLTYLGRGRRTGPDWASNPGGHGPAARL